MVNEDRKYDLGERTAQFAGTVISFLKEVPQTAISRPLISQLVRSATSVGANYCEAHDAVSKNDFRYRISICRKEAKETAYWLRMIMIIEPRLKEQCAVFADEAIQLNRIFSASIKTLGSAK